MNLKVFSNRSFAVGSLVVGVFGAVIYGMVTIMQLFYQTLIGMAEVAAVVAFKIATRVHQIKIGTAV